MRHVLFLILLADAKAAFNSAQSCSARNSAKSRIEAVIDKKSESFYLHARKRISSGEELLLSSDLEGGEADEICSRVV